MAVSRRVNSNQSGLHPNLERVVTRHLLSSYQRRASSETLAIAADVRQRLESYPGGLVLDSGCGVGESTYRLAVLYSNCLVIGVDKSSVRLAKFSSLNCVRSAQDNIQLINSDAVDLWLALKQYGIRVARHYLLYPNPWPKKKHLMRRWHAHAIFPTLIALGGELTLRTNWKTYADEFACSLAIAGMCSSGVCKLTPSNQISPFERKYHASQHELFELRASLPNLLVTS